MKLKQRRLALAAIVAASYLIILTAFSPLPSSEDITIQDSTSSSHVALKVLNRLDVKPPDLALGYSREMFGTGWKNIMGCDMRNIILNRDLKDVVVGDDCHVLSGVLNDPYTGSVIKFRRGPKTSSLVQIDHVVALSDAWRKGASSFSYDKRVEFANDPLELLSVDGRANQQKSGGDASAWLPDNESFRCEYVARQVAIKFTYGLWVSKNEHDSISRVLGQCSINAVEAIDRLFDSLGLD